MRAFTVTLLLLLVACGGSTGPAGLDPTVLVTNDSGPVGFSLTWFDQSGQVATVAVPMGTTQCVHFTSTQIADSVRFIAAMGASSLDTLPGRPGTTWTKSWSPWFDPKNGLPTASPGQYPFGLENMTLDVPARYSLRIQR